MPGIAEEGSRVFIGVHTADPDVAADFMQAAVNPTLGQISLQAGVAAGGAAGPSVADAMSTDVTLGGIMASITGLRTDWRNDVQMLNTNVVDYGNKVVKVQHSVNKINTRVTKVDTRVTKVDTRVTLVSNRVTALQVASKREQQALVGDINTTLQAIIDEQTKKDAARDAAHAAEMARLQQKMEAIEKAEAARKEDEAKIQTAMVVDVVQPRVEKRKRGKPDTYVPEPQPKPRPARVPVVEDAIYAYAKQNWKGLVFKTKAKTDFVWIFDMIEQLETKGVPGKLNEAQIKRLMRSIYKVRPVKCEWKHPDAPSGTKADKFDGFRQFVVMPPAEHAQFLAGF